MILLPVNSVGISSCVDALGTLSRCSVCFQELHRIPGQFCCQTFFTGTVSQFPVVYRSNTRRTCRSMPRNLILTLWVRLQLWLLPLPSSSCIFLPAISLISQFLLAHNVCPCRSSTHVVSCSSDQLTGVLNTRKKSLLMYVVQNVSHVPCDHARVFCFEFHNC